MRRRRRLDLTADRATVALGVTAGLAPRRCSSGRSAGSGIVGRPRAERGGQPADRRAGGGGGDRPGGPRGLPPGLHPGERVFNLLGSFVTTFLSARLITHRLRNRLGGGPVPERPPGTPAHPPLRARDRDRVCLGRRGDRDPREGIEPKLAVPFGVGMGLTLDESALLLELDDVYWRREGIVSVQITLAVIALLSALALALRLFREGEQVVLEPAAV